MGQGLASTVVLIVVLVLLRSIVARAVKRTVASQELRRRWLLQTRNAALAVLALGLLVIWGSELRTLAVSLVAIAMAIVLATKELILCVSGSFLKAGARSFRLGDRIQVKDIRGDVIDQTLLSTTVMEIGPGRLTHQRTGRVTVLPNSLFLSEPVTNESYTDDYVFHAFTVPLKREEDWQHARQVLHDAASEHCAPFLEHARAHMEAIGHRTGLDVPDVEPRVTVQMPTAGEVHLVVRVPVQAGQRGRIEHTILNAFLEKVDAERTPSSATAASSDRAQTRKENAAAP